MPVANKTSLAIAQDEARMLNEGIDRFARRQKRLADAGAAAEREDYSHLIRQSLLDVSTRIEHEIEAANEPRARGRLLVKLNGIDPNTIAYISLSSVYSRLVKTNKEMTIAVDIGLRLNDEVRFNTIKEQDPKLLKRLVKFAGEKQGSERHKTSFVFNTAEHKEGITTEEWPLEDQTNIGKYMLKLLQECGLIKVETLVHKAKKTSVVSLSQSSLEWLEQHRTQAASGLLPMVSPVFSPLTEPPKDWTGPVGGGYYTTSYPLVRGAMATQWDMPQVYKAINLAQRSPWRLHRGMFEVVKYMWSHGIVAGKLPDSTILPEPERMDDKAFKKLSEDERKKYLIDRREVYEHNRQAVSDKVMMDMVLAQAEIYLDEPEVYMPYFLDYRGRAYCAPLLNPQGSGYMRSMFEFAEGKPMTAQGAAWVGIQVATLWDGKKERLSKAPFLERLEWCNANEEFLRAVVDDPMGDTRWMQADKPFLFLRSAIDWVAYLDYGTDAISHLPIALDGTCSGIQHYSAMLRDSDTGRRVNLLPSDVPADVYSDVAGAVIDRVLADPDSPEKAFWIDVGISRKVVKKPTMTYGYSSRLQGFTEWYDSQYVKPYRPKIEKRDPVARYLGRHTLSAVEEMLSSVAKGMDWLQHCVKLLAHEGKGISWVTPSGFPVHQEIRERNAIRVSTQIGGERIRISVPGKPGPVSRDHQKNAIGPNFVHSMDAAHLVLTVLHANKEYGITEFALIHDSFGTLAADTHALFTAVREAFVEMYQQNDPLTSLYDSVCEALSPAGREKLQFPPDKGDLDITEVIRSLYAFA